MPESRRKGGKEGGKWRGADRREELHSALWNANYLD